MSQIRRERIKEIISRSGTVSIDELVTMLKVSNMTIYRDIKILQEEGFLTRIKGGARVNPEYKLLTADSPKDNYEYHSVENLFLEQKQAIAKRALDYLEPASTIILDNATTVYELAKLLKNYGHPLTVCVTSKTALDMLADIPSITLYSCGGLYSRSSNSFIGSAAEECIERMNANVCFIGAMGITQKSGLTDAFPAEANLKKKIISSSKKVIVLAAGHKLGEIAMEKVANLSELDVIITDWGAKDTIVSELSEDTKVITCDNTP